MSYFMIRPTKIRELLLSHATSENRAPHLAAASGLVNIGSTLYVVADDENHLGVFSADTQAPGDFIRLFEGTLPEKTKKRKAEKRDLETLTQLPAFAGYAHGALLALGSGSKPNRATGVLLGLDANGQVNTAPQHIDLALLYDDLRNEFDALNIEGAVISGDDLVLLQRGNRCSKNALIRLSVAAFLNDLTAGYAPRLHRTPTSMTIDLGNVDDVPFSFTDGAALINGVLLFTAVAENTNNAIDDGACNGSAIGIINADGKIARMERIEPAYKVEGVVASIRDRHIHVQLVTDGDDASKPAWLLSAVLPWG
jgi:hypothetical protein